MKFCQSCGSPLINNLQGTEKDGSVSEEYCGNCYSNGKFREPRMTLDKMKTIVKNELGDMHSHYLIEREVNILSALKRWRPSLTNSYK